MCDPKIVIVNSLENDCPQYRLGDAILKRGERYGKIAFDFVADNERCFHNSVLYNYANRINRDSSDPQFDILREVVDHNVAEGAFAKPKDNELVVHLRMGDLKGYKLSADVCAAGILEATNKLENAVTTVTLVTAIHFGKSYFKESEEPHFLSESLAKTNSVIEDIIKLLQKSGLPVKIFSNKEIDKDFCYLANAKFTVLGNGHFSLCAAMISDAKVIVPNWARSGTDLNIDNMLAQHKI